MKIADSPTQFIRAAEDFMSKGGENTDWLHRVDEFLADMSWDKTWAQMSDLINQTIGTKQKGNARPVLSSNVRPPRAAVVIA